MKQTLAELAETAVRNSGGELDDDISIAVLSRAEDDVLFPQDVTWLCACGARNRLENSYCFRCGRDFLTLYSVQPRFVCQIRRQNAVFPLRQPTQRVGAEIFGRYHQSKQMSDAKEMPNGRAI